MAYEMKDNSGSLFQNDKKDKETSPDYKGSLKIDGVEYWISGWKKSKEGKTWLSLALTKKEQKAEQEIEF
jgi:hypothetical protein